MAELVFHNLDIVIRRIKAVGEGAPKYMQDVLNRVMAEDIWPLWIKQISLQDHSLEDLAKLGHPYSTRFGADSFVHRDVEIHQQSGDLVQSSRIIQRIGSGEVTCVLANSSPHYIFLRYGTRNMRIRDPAGEVMKTALPLIKKRFANEVRGAIIEFLTR